MFLAHFRSALGGAANRIFPSAWLAWRIRRRDRHFEPEYWLVEYLCDRQHIALDIGSNMGEYAFYMMRFAKTVIAFEPNTELWPALQRRLGKHVRLESAALSDRAGSALFRYVRENTGVATIEEANSLQMVQRQERIRTRTVELRTLDSFNLTGISFIKIDVEGHEEAVLRGARETLERNRPIILVESEDRHNPGAPQRLREALAAQGYRGFFICDRRLCNVETITGELCNSANVGIPGKTYINNFIFVPSEGSNLLPSLENAVANH